MSCLLLPHSLTFFVAGFSAFSFAFFFHNAFRRARACRLTGPQAFVPNLIQSVCVCALLSFMLFFCSSFAFHSVVYCSNHTHTLIYIHTQVSYQFRSLRASRDFIRCSFMCMNWLCDYCFSRIVRSPSLCAKSLPSGRVFFSFALQHSF